MVSLVRSIRATRSLCVKVQFFFEPIELSVSLANDRVEAFRELFVLRALLGAFVRENQVCSVNKLLFPKTDLYRMHFVLAAQLIVRLETLDGLDGDERLLLW